MQNTSDTGTQLVSASINNPERYRTETHVQNEQYQYSDSGHYQLRGEDIFLAACPFADPRPKYDPTEKAAVPYISTSNEL